MKLFTFLLMIACLTTHGNGFSQQVNLSGRNVELEKIFKDINRQTGYTFVYTESLLKKAKRVTISINNASLEEALDACLKNQPLSYTILNTMIVIKEKAMNTPDKEVVQETSPLTIQISGRVTDENGQPLEGATVLIKGTNDGVKTDANGNFSIDAEPNATLIISYVGYEIKEIKISGRSSIVIGLEPLLSISDEITIVGYGTQKRTSLTSAVSDIKGEDLNKRSVANAQQTLQGLASGVTVIDRGGYPGESDVMIRVRGITTLSGNDPLVMVDGIEQSLKDINPNDIENIAILKDAASTAIYGSRAANGVILVTTKRAKKGSLLVNLNSYYAIQNVIYNPKQMGMEDYMRMQNVAYENAGATAPFPEDTIKKWVNSTDRIRYPLVNDWINVMFSPAPQQDHTLTLSGGTDRVRSLLSLNLFDQGGVIPNSHSQQPSVRLNTDFKVSERITVSGDFNYRIKNYMQPTQAETSIKYMWASSNFAVPRYPDGTYGLSSDGISPLVQAELRGVSHFKNSFGMANLKADIEIIDGLNFETQYGVTVGGLNSKVYSNAYEIRDYWNPSIILQQVTVNSLTESRDYSEQSTLNNLLTYEKNVNKHFFKALLGYSQIGYKYNYLSASRKDFYNNQIQSLSQGSLSSRDNTGYESAWGLRSYFGRFNYNFEEKYFIELNGRYDGSSRFVDKNRYSFFPSISGAWRLSKENFWLPLRSTINEFKIRGSWGKTGNQSVGLYSYLETLSALNYNFGGTPVQGLYQSSVANSDLTWETTTQSDIGLDASFLGNKFGFSFDYYNKRTDGILLYLPVPLALGLNAPPQNAGSVENKGWELHAYYKSAFRDFHYGIGFNLSDVSNKITSLAGTGPYIYNDYWVSTIQQEGLPINSYIGYKSDGFFKTQDEVDNYPTLFPGTVPGDLKYLDMNKDGVLNASDMVYIGSDIPHFSFGLNMNFDYKNFDMNVFFQGVGKVQAMIGEAAGNIEWQSFVMDFEKDYWTPDNPNAKFPRPEAFADKNWVNSDFWLVNSAYLKLKNIQLGYSLPESFVQKLRIQRLRLYIAKSNVFTISPVNKWGMDPEFNVSMREYPQLSLNTVGLNLTF
ncbi:MAG: TonB-dependent receptor [Chitinophagaceae bacterium]|nr:TonB-dependent receptor [Chitinophagaceae bacterium]